MEIPERNVMVVLTLFLPHGARRIYESGRPNTELVMQFHQCQSLSWNSLSSNQSSVGGVSGMCLKKLDLTLEKRHHASKVTGENKLKETTCIS